MVFRFILRYLLNDKVVDKLANSTPIRRAAQWVVYLVHKTNDQSIKFASKEIDSRKFQKIAQFWQSLVNLTKPSSTINNSEFNDQSKTTNPIGREAQWMNQKAKADNIKFSLNKDYLKKNFPKLAEVVITIIGITFKPTKPLSRSDHSKEHEQTKTTYSAIDENESSSVNKPISSADSERKLKAYIEELKKRTQQ